MKKLSVISAAVLAALSMTGCNTNNGGTYTINAERIEKSTWQTVGGSTVITDYTWDETNATQTGEVQKTNGQTDYSIDDFESSFDSAGREVSTRIRTRKNEAGDEIREKLVTTYGVRYGNQMLETEHEEYLLGSGDEETLVLRRTTEWNGNGQQTEVKEYRGEVLTLHQRNFDYGYSNTSYTFFEKEEGKDEVKKGFRWTDALRRNYERYVFDADGEDIVYEERTDYEIDGDKLTIEYTITEYDTENEDADPVVTNVTDEYIIIEITITY